MKIYITGFSGSGKTTLAKSLNKTLGYPLFHSDFILSKYNLENRKKTELSEQEYAEKIKQLENMENWIFEGRHMVTDLLDQADKIIWVKTSLMKSLFWQWKRYFTDPEQRKRFTFRNNLQLSINIIFEQHLGKENINRTSDPRHTPSEKYERILSHYKNKLVVIRNNDDFKTLFEHGILSSEDLDTYAKYHRF